MATPLKKGNPVWLAIQDENDPNLNKNYRRSCRYYKQLYQAWPEWCAEHPDFAVIYKKAKQMTKEMNEPFHVDHIVPICNELVCGLHVPWNLQILHEKANLTKSNIWWPDGPFEKLDLF